MKKQEKKRRKSVSMNKFNIYVRFEHSHINILMVEREQNKIIEKEHTPVDSESCSLPTISCETCKIY